ncbi:SsrA-binding protein SmpB [Candidatus Azambacteria bacterium]|nr:SsrA-binding protein SmpB [Candidatus Azambacteria bacterium]
MALLAENKKVLFDYEILDRYRAGIVLFGFEAKAAFSKKANLAGSFVIIRGGEAFWINAPIAPYQPQNTPAGYDKTRPRKLLLTKREIAELAGKTAKKGLTLIPISLYNEGRKIKLEFGLARSKKKFEKREDIKKKEFTREKAKIMKHEA